MAISNISDNPIENVRNAINNRLSTYPTNNGDTNASVSKKAIDEQNKQLIQREMSNKMFSLLLTGYIITAVMLLLVGFKLGNFYLESYVLAVLIGSSMGTSAYMFKRIADLIFG